MKYSIADRFYLTDIIEFGYNGIWGSYNYFCNKIKIEKGQSCIALGKLNQKLWNFNFILRWILNILSDFESKAYFPFLHKIERIVLPVAIGNQAQNTFQNGNKNNTSKSRKLYALYCSLKQKLLLLL